MFKIGKYEISWSEIGKIAVGLFTIVVSFLIFQHVPKGFKTLALIILVGLFFGYRYITRKKAPAIDLENKLKDKDKNVYG